MLRSIGYRGRPLHGVPFDERRGLIRNDGGRVIDEDGERPPGEYVVGWIKRGPSGVIGTNKKDAADTVARIVEDAEAGGSTSPAEPDADDDRGVATPSRARRSSTWDGWQAIDAHETRPRRARTAARASSSCAWPSWSPPAASRRTP